MTYRRRTKRLQACKQPPTDSVSGTRTNDDSDSEGEREENTNKKEPQVVAAKRRKLRKWSNSKRVSSNDMLQASAAKEACDGIARV